MILLIDNYDSFVFNLERYLRELGCETKTVRNDQFSVPEIAAQQPAAILISPGPGTPESAGISIAIVRELGRHVPILGVCLGHQAIAVAYGAAVMRSPDPTHGEASQIVHAGRDLFAGVPSPLTVGRYHSLAIDESTLPESLVVTARTADGQLMAIRHAEHPVYGVQFHPESILTTGGHSLLRNFLRLANIPVGEHLPEPEYSAADTDGSDFYRLPITDGSSRPW